MLYERIFDLIYNSLFLLQVVIQANFDSAQRFWAREMRHPKNK